MIHYITHGVPYDNITHFARQIPHSWRETPAQIFTASHPSVNTDSCFLLKKMRAKKTVIRGSLVSHRQTAFGQFPVYTRVGKQSVLRHQVAFTMLFFLFIFSVASSYSSAKPTPRVLEIGLLRMIFQALKSGTAILELDSVTVNFIVNRSRHNLKTI